MLFLYLADEYEISGNTKNIKEIMTYMNVTMPDSIIKIQIPRLKLYTAQKYLSGDMIEDYNRIINTK